MWFFYIDDDKCSSSNETDYNCHSEKKKIEREGNLLKNKNKERNT